MSYSQKPKTTAQIETGTLPTPMVVSSDLLEQFVITAIDSALVSGGVGGGGTTTGVVAPPQRIARAQ